MAVVADTYWQSRKALAALKPQFDDAGHGAVSSADDLRRVRQGDRRRARHAVRRRNRDHGRLPRAVSPARDDGADGVHGARDGRSRGGLGRHAGSAQRAQPRRPRRWISAPSKCSTRISRSAAASAGSCPSYLDFVGMSARIAKEMSPAPVKMIWSRETDMQHGYYRPAAMARFAGALDAAGAPLKVACVVCRRRRRRIDVHAVCDCRQGGDRARREAPRPDRPVAVGPELATRLLQGGVHRRDGARGEEGSVRVPPRPDDRSPALQGGARARGGDGELGLAAAAR